MMAPVKVYSSGNCLYCMKAKSMLEKWQIEYEETRIDLDQATHLAAGKGQRLRAVFQRLRLAGFADAVHRAVLQHPADHVAAKQEGQPAEHLLCGEAVLDAEIGAHGVCHVLGTGHQRPSFGITAKNFRKFLAKFFEDF